MRRVRRAFARSPFDAEIIKLALPALGALAADPLVSLVDTAFVGRLGTTELGALGVAVAVFGVFFAVFNFLAYGTTPLLGKALGANDGVEAGRIGASAMTMAVGFGVVFSVLMIALATPLLELLGASDSLVGPGSEYLRIRALALPAVLIVLTGHGVFRGAQDTATPFRLTLALNVVNLVLDPLFIFGFDLNLAGAAWATVIAQWVGAAMFAISLRNRGEAMGIQWQRPSLSAIVALLKAGGVLVLRTAGLLAAFTVATSVAARIGDVEVAAHQILFQVFLFLALVLDAIAVAAMSMLGRVRGEVDAGADPEVLLWRSDRLVGLGILAGIGLGAVLMAVRPWLAGWFTNEPEIVQAIDGAYLQLVLMQVVGGALFAWDGVVVGVTEFTHSMLATVLPSIVITTALVLLAASGTTLAVVWWSLLALIGLRTLYLATWHALRMQPDRFRAT